MCVSVVVEATTFKAKALLFKAKAMKINLEVSLKASYTNVHSILNKLSSIRAIHNAVNHHELAV